MDFLIVGTPRSGTTLAQRLACELVGVRMPPETHFFGFFALDMLRRARFPLSGVALRRELDSFARADKSVELFVDVSAVEERLGGRCSSAVEMFGAIVRTLAGDATLYGEKSPEHLMWWRPLAEAMPRAKVVAVVRDPRSVVASMIAAWPPPRRRGVDPHAVRAERWAADQREVMAAAGALGPGRCIVLRYEDMVANPAAARARIASLLGVESSDGRAGGGPGRIVLPRERAWKARVFEEVTTDRVDAWRSSMPAAAGAAVAALCRREMLVFGYPDAPARRAAVAATARLHPRTQSERARFRLGRARHMRRIATVRVGEPRPTMPLPVTTLEGQPTCT